MDDRQKIPVPRHSFLWSLNETSGEILTHVGPTEFTPSANDRIVRANARGGYESASMEARPFILVRDGEYVLLENPVPDEECKEGPNGSFVPGGNKEKRLSLGTTKVIPGPCAFPLWPGQSAEVRPAHKLGANHYLLVEVVGAVDNTAPYYQLVIDSAGLSSAVIDTSEGAESTEGEEGAGQSDDVLRIGQRIVIQGRHTQLFIPPTGIQVVPQIEETESSSDDDGVGNLSESNAEELAGLLAQVQAGLTSRQFSVLKNELRHRDDLGSGVKAIMLTALDDTWSKRRDVKSARDKDRRTGRTMDPYARRAVVLGPKNFCYLFDADGNPRIVRGPARVFPGPQDTFLHRGSRRRVYDAYELGEHQALWLRIISPVTKEALAQRLPEGVELDKDRYHAGDELLVRGQPSVFFPFIEAEVLNPSSRDPHVGNDHDNVVIDAIGIDQKSGVYVRDLETGKVKMVRGEKSYLVDPRKEQHVARRVPAKDWNLWIARSEPHKRSAEDVESPWAVSVIVPNNEAIEITSRHGRRVVEGPVTELLEYEERLTALGLSEGPSKDGSTRVLSCFLRVRGGQTEDTFDIESSDFVRFRVKAQLTYGFSGSNERWFNVEDPIKLIADEVRGRVRAAARSTPATELVNDLPDVVAAALFGGGSEPVEIEDNGMVVEAVDVVSYSLVDPALAKLFDEAHRELVTLQLKDLQATRRLESTRYRDSVDASEHSIQREANRRMSETTRLEAEDQHAVELRKLVLTAERKQEVESRENSLLSARTEQEIERQRLTTEAQAAHRLVEAEAAAKANKLEHDEAVQFSAKDAEIQRGTAKALAEADAVRLAAIQSELVAALHGAADSEVMKAAANNMNLVALLGGKSPAELFTKLLEGTPLARTSEGMARRNDGRRPPEAE